MIAKKFTNLSLFCYDDYRLYLQDVYNLKKSEDAGYSYRKYGEDFGFSSPGYVLQIIKGKRNLGKSSIALIQKKSAFSKEEKEYFNLLVQMDHAAEERKEQYKDALDKIRKRRSRTFRLTEPLQYYLSNRMCSVIPLLIRVYGSEFRPDPLWISRKLHIKSSTGEIEAALVFLLREKLIVREEGQYRVTYNRISTNDEKKSKFIREAHSKILDEAIDCLRLPLENREFGHSTVVVPTESLGQIKDKIKSMQEEFKTWIEHSVLQGDEAASKKMIAVFNTQFYTILG